jgi:hypothetical protein
MNRLVKTKFYVTISLETLKFTESRDNFDLSHPHNPIALLQFQSIANKKSNLFLDKLIYLSLTNKNKYTVLSIVSLA